MKNKTKLKRYAFIITIISLIVLTIFFLLNIYEIKTYQKIYNNKINSLLVQIEKDYPNVDKNELIKLLNNNTLDESFAHEYGIDYKVDNLVIENNYYFKRSLIINTFFLIFVILIIVIVFLIYNIKRDKEINDIIKLLENINNKNYQIDMNEMSEDILSILRQEVYKTAILLNSMSDNALKDKQNLKESLSDISHQIKTPITSILINLDLLIYNYDMDNSKKMELIRKVKRETNNISDLVQYILKLARFDVNAVKFDNKNVLIDEIIDTACLNVSTLCELKNIHIEKQVNNKISIYCDKKWQTEAITNILKNSIEHSKSNSRIIVKVLDNKSYFLISITNFGKKIDSEKLKHIFDRFYQDSDLSLGNTGLGLSLTKKIVEMNNGKISVKSNKSSTEFIVKYFKFH